MNESENKLRAPIYTTRPVTELGWKRRPERDTGTIDAWEMPDGTMYAAEKGRVPRVILPRGLAGDQAREDVPE